MDFTGNLVPVRFFTKDDAYHYTVENRPLQDLAERDVALAQALNDRIGHIDTLTFQGPLQSSFLSFSLLPYSGKTFAIKAKVTAINDPAEASPQSITYQESLIFGKVTISGAVTIQAVNSIHQYSTGALSACTTSFTANGSNIIVNFLNYNLISNLVKISFEVNTV